jgi:PTS system galactitol-specific IIB component
LSKQKVVLVACGTGIATSTVVAVGIEEAMRDRGLNVVTRQCKVAEINGHLSGIDLIVTTTSVTGDFGVPVIQTLAFLTGIGKPAVLDKIADYLSK